MTTPKYARPRPRKRLKKIASSLATLSLVATGSIALTTLNATPAQAAQENICPSDEADNWPGMTENLPLFTDNNVAVHVGGDALFNNGESEGLIVVEGDLTIDRNPAGLYNLGYVGVGSQILPGDGQLMLAVGGDLDISSDNTTSVQVGRNPDPEGQYMVQGSISDTAKVDVGIESSYNLSNTPAEDFGTKVAAGSEQLRDATQTGSYTWSGGQWDPLVFTGDGTSDLQIFEVPSEVLSGIKSVDFDNIPEDAAVVVNVTGDNVTLSQDLVYARNGNSISAMTGEAGHFAAHTLWNFHEASDIEIGEDGAYDGQFLGSILVGNPDSTLKTFESTNGRVYTLGDFETSGNGREIHNYPFVGYLPFSCVPNANDDPSGTFNIQKDVVGDGAGSVPADTEFEVNYTVNGEDAEEPLIITADGEVVSGPEFDVGDEIAFTEADPDDINGAAFTGYTITIDGEETDTVSIQQDANHDVVVTNRYVPAGGFTLHKQVDADGDFPEDTEFTFDVTIGDDTEEVTLSNAESQTFRQIELGTDVTITETTPDVAGFEWAGVSFETPSISDPAVDGNTLSFTLAGEGSDHAIEAVNTFTADEPASGGFALQKAVDADGNFPEDATFTFDITIGDGDTETVTLSAGETSDAFTNIEEGTEVQIAETTPLIDGYDWEGVTFTGVDGEPEGNTFTFTISENDELTIIATNTFTEQEDLTGSFNIHKELAGEGADLIDPETGFDIDYTVNDGETETLTIQANGNVVDGPELNVGDDVVFSEVTPAEIDGVVFEGTTITIDGEETDTLTIGEDAEAEVTVTNTYLVEEVPTGGFSLEKNVDADEEFPRDTEFTFNVSIGDGDSQSVSLADGDTAVFDDIELNTEVTIVEETPTVDGYTWDGVDFDHGDQDENTVTFTITEEGTDLTVTANNTFAAVAPDTGDFTLEKAVEADGDFPEDATFTFDVTIGDQTENVNLADGENHEFTDIEFGTEVTIAEDEVNIAGFDWEGVTFNEGDNGDNTASFVLDEETQGILVTATNTYSAVEQATGTFNIHKVVEGEGSDLIDSDTEFSVDYTVNGDNADESLTITANGTVVNGPELNVGDEVAFSEATPAEVDGAEFDGSTITIDGQETNILTISEDSDAEVIVTNTYSTTDEGPKGDDNGDEDPKDDDKKAPESLDDDKGGFLPRTGSEIATYALAALLMLGAGTAIFTGIRRKNHG